MKLDSTCQSAKLKLCFTSWEPSTLHVRPTVFQHPPHVCEIGQHVLVCKNKTLFHFLGTFNSARRANSLPKPSSCSKPSSPKAMVQFASAPVAESRKVQRLGRGGRDKSCGSRYHMPGVQRPLRVASLAAPLVLKGRCLPVRTAWKQLWCSKAAAACQPAPLRTVWKQLWCSKAAAGCQPAPLASSFGAQRPLRAASLHRLQVTRCRLPARAALVLKGRCGLPARTAGKQLWCSKAAGSCQPAPLGSSWVAQTPLRAASAPLGSSFGAKRPLRAASPHRLEAALVLNSHCGLRDRTA